MADRWFYTQGGQERGPVSAAELMHLAAAGKLAPQDLLWPEGADRSQAVTVESAVRPPAAPAPAKEPDWLGDVKKSEKAAPPPPLAPRAGAPDWLEDVRLAEQTAPPQAAMPGEEATVEIIAPGRPPRLAVGAATSRGRVRDRNEDRFLVQQLAWSEAEGSHQVSLLVVADGMGGYQGGDEAAALVVRTVGRVLSPVLLQALDGEDLDKALPRLAGAIDGALQEANDAVAQRAQQGAQFQGMGATAAVVLVWDDRALVGHVGDCRVYHHSADLLRQVTRDQTLVARMVELGQLSPREAARHPSRNEVTQAIGKRARLEPGRAEVALTRGDWLVVCCDGLYAHVSDAALEKAIGESLLAADLAHYLVTTADQGGGSDNCTVIAAFYD
jgi:serine/threonine protein phosphatase PrpC